MVVTTVAAGTGTIFLDNVECTGNENALYNCPNQGIGNHNCVHSEDVGVTCTVRKCNFFVFIIS